MHRNALALLVLEQVHLVVARSDGAELVARHLLEVADRLDLLPERAVEQRVIDLLGIAAAETEADIGSDLVDQRTDAIRDRGLRHVELDRHVAAGGVEADTAHGNVLLVGDDAADRLRIAEVAVRTEDATNHAANLHAARHLLLRAIVVTAEDPNLRHGTLLAFSMLPTFELVRAGGFEPPVSC